MDLRDRGEFAAAGFGDAGGSAAAGEYFQHGWVADPRADGVFEGGVDAGEQAADAVAESGGFAGEVVVESGQHVQFGQGFVADVDGAQGAGGVGDDERVPGVGFGAAGVEVGDAVHRQAGQVGDLVPGDRDRQRADGGRLVDHDQQCSVLGEFVEQGSQLGFGVGQRGVMQSFAVGVETDRVMSVLADVQAEEHAKVAAHPPCRSSAVTWSPCWASSAGTHVTTRPTQWWPCPYQRSLDATRPGDTTPRIMYSTGGVSHAGSGDHSSLIRNYEKGNGAIRSGAGRRCASWSGRSAGRCMRAAIRRCPCEAVIRSC